jgi:glycosyltransferase involved in cell wall biosynthesis
MLSILIPVYNFDVRKLVRDLHSLCEKAGIVYEILVYDDHSENVFPELNQSVTTYNTVRYKQLSENKGRSGIRNLLASEAVYENLIFIDCDMHIVSDQYIKDYIRSMDHADAVFGGLIYAEAPKDRNKMLRWKYGTEREAIPAIQREKKPFISMKTCNLLIRKKVFDKIGFSEDIEGYGYEDTLFGIQLKRFGFTVAHIDNPLIHTGLEDADVYLEKTTTAMKNLRRMMNNPELKNHLSELKIIEHYRFEKKLGVSGLTLLNYSTFRPVILKNLRSKNPNLKLFDLFKLVHLFRSK